MVLPSLLSVRVSYAEEPLLTTEVPSDNSTSAGATSEKKTTEIILPPAYPPPPDHQLTYTSSVADYNVPSIVKAVLDAQYTRTHRLLRQPGDPGHISSSQEIPRKL